ncbi:MULTISPECIES: dermonecrotic toxin domain-containing protein [Pseudomonas]|uniref:dermonecrotic toxin domain-containing protein n=1 Tax=Pseudomonas TaxID=286 RepID=UPI00257FA8E2|nr:MULTISPECIES: DUF6543 domain-containing protein [Pseudomonas]
MSNTLPWFHARSLAQRMSRHLLQALEEERLSVIEHDWLRQLPEQPSLPNGMRISLLTNAAPGIFSGLMIAHADIAKPAVYFYSPMAGILPFFDRDELEAALLEPGIGFELEGSYARWLSVSRTPFQRWMEAIIQANVRRLKPLLACLRGLPALRTVLDQQLTGALRTALPASDPIVPALHRVQRRVGTPGAVETTQNLIEVGLDVLTGRAKPSVEHVFTGVYGQALSVAEAATFTTTITTTVATLPRAFDDALVGFWASTPPAAASSYRTLMSQHLKHSYLNAVLEIQAHLGYSPAQRTLLMDAAQAKPGANIVLQGLSFAADPAKADRAVPWPGVLVISDRSDTSLGYCVYSCDQGFTLCNDFAALNQHFDTLIAQASTSPRIIASQRALFNATIVPRPQLIPFLGSPWEALANGFIDLQRRRAHDCFATPAQLHANPLAALAQATALLDLLEPNLGWLDEAGKHASPASTTGKEPGDVHGQTWLRELQSMQHQLDGQRKRSLSLVEGVQRLLAPGLLAIQSTLGADELHLRIAGAPQLSSIRLVDYFLERCSGAIVQPLSSVDDVLDARGNTLRWPDTLQIERLIGEQSRRLPRAFAGLAARHDQAPHAHYRGTYDLQGQRRAITERCLRITLGSARREGRIDENMLGWLDIALNRPTAALRNALDVEVQSLCLRARSDRSEVVLSNLFLVHRRSQPEGPVLMWSTQDGLRAFSSAQQMKETVATVVTQPQTSLHLASGRYFRDRSGPIQDNAKLGGASDLTTHILRGDFIDELCALEFNRRLYYLKSNLELGIDCHFSTQLMQGNTDFGRSDDTLAAALEWLGTEIANNQLVELLPNWLKQASKAQITRYTEILRRCVWTTDVQGNYLANIPYILDFSRDRLKEAMRKAWPQGPYNPDRVQITLTDTSGGGVNAGGGIALGNTASVTRSLTQWAVDQFGGSLSSAMTIALDPPSQTITPPSTYQIRTLVDQADIGGAYRTMLAERLAPTASDYAERRRLFARGVPPQMLRYAAERQMQGKLSNEAVNLLEQVMEMPDGLAREPLHHHNIIIAPFGLVADTDVAADRACAMFLIAPDDNAAGPVVLYSAYGGEQTLLEFADRASLLAQVKTDNGLQALIMSRLPEQAKPRYQHGGFKEPHIPWTTEVGDGQRPGRPPAITLSDDAYTGNALFLIFEDTMKLIQLAAKEQTLSAGEATWNAFCHLLELGLQQGSVMLPSAVASLVALYQGVVLVRDSVEAAKEQKWGEAVADLVAALASVVGSRQALDDLEWRDSSKRRPSAEVAASEQGSLGTSGLTALKNAQATDVVLSQLHFDPLLNLYKSVDGSHRYAVVGGRVFEVADADVGLKIISAQGDGPTIELDEQQKWRVDAEVLRMGGGYSIAEHYDIWVAEQNLVDLFMTQAEGALQMRQQYPRRHRQLVDAHAHSVDCLRNTLANLNQAAPHMPLAAETNAVLTDIFEVDVTPAILHQIRSSCLRLLSEFTAPGLDPQTSPRYWMGMNKQGHAGTHAFVWETDPLQRIFLTEQFYVLPPETVMYSNLHRSQNDMFVHHQASSLLHEVSHQVLKTVDIAYMDSFRPLLEQYDNLGGPYSQAQLYAHSLNRVRHEALSLSTPDKTLFTRRGTNGRRDFRNYDGRQREMILKLSGQSTLAEARVAFRGNPEVRAKIILANADSLTLLVLRLGQEVFGTTG